MESALPEVVMGAGKQNGALAGLSTSEGAVAECQRLMLQLGGLPQW